MGWSEIFVIGIVALIVVGPKDLPGMFRELGRFSARIKGMAREFQTAMNDAADQSGAGDIAKSLRSVANPKSMGLDALKSATSWDDDTPKAGAPASLPKDRADAAAKIQAATAKAATDRIDAEAKAKDATPEPETAPASDPEAKA